MNKKLLLMLVLIVFLVPTMAFATTASAKASYNFDAGLTEQSGNGTTATQVGCSLNTSTKLVGAGSYWCDGTTGNIDLGEAYLGSNTAFSAGGFFYLTDSSVNQMLFKTGATNTNGFYLYLIGSSGDIRLQFDSGTSKRLDISQSVNSSEWFHIWVEHDGTTARVYLNNVEIGSKSMSYTTPTTNNFQVMSNDGASLFTKGNVDQFMIYVREIGTTDRTALYNNKLGFDPYYVAPVSSDTLTVVGRDAGNNSELSNLNVTWNGTTYTNATGNIVSINISAEGGNIDILHNFSVVSENYFSESVTNWNLTNTYNANLTQYPTVQAHNSFTGAQINTFNATINSTLYQTSSGLIYVPYNASFSTLLEAEGYFNETIVHDYSAGNLDQAMDQSIIEFKVSEIYTGNNINEFNLTLTNGTKYQTTNGSIFLNPNVGTINFTADVKDYFSQNVSYNVVSLDNKTITFTDFYDSELNLRGIQEQNPAINISSFTATINPNGTSIPYSTTTFNVTIPTLLNDTYNISLSAPAYFSKSQNFTVNQVSQSEVFNLSLAGGVLFNFRDSDTTALITDPLTLIVQNATFSQTYEFSGGSQIVTNLTDGQEFNFYFYGSGYQTNTYFLTYANQSVIDLYLINGSDNITYNLVSEANTPLQDVEITVDKFINGTWTQIASQLTDATGLSIFGLERGVSHRITFQKDGFVSRIDYNRFTATTFTIVMDQSGDFDFDLGYQYITANLNPKNTSLTPSNVYFSLNLTSTQPIIEFVTFKLYHNGTLLKQDNTTSNVGGFLNFTQDLSAYNDSLVLIEYTYKLQNRTEITTGTKVYRVSDVQHYDGTLLELKDRLSDSLTNGERIALYALVFFITLIFVSIFATGLPAVVAGLSLATLAGWVFGINILLLLFVTGVIAIFTIAFTGDNI